jgi:hypothetical protein
MGLEVEDDVVVSPMPEDDAEKEQTETILDANELARKNRCAVLIRGCAIIVLEGGLLVWTHNSKL